MTRLGTNFSLQLLDLRLEIRQPTGRSGGVPARAGSPSATLAFSVSPNQALLAAFASGSTVSFTNVAFSVGTFTDLLSLSVMSTWRMRWVQSDLGKALEFEVLLPGSLTLSAGARTGSYDFASNTPSVTGCASVGSMTLFDTSGSTAIAPIATDLDATVTWHQTNIAWPTSGSSITGSQNLSNADAVGPLTSSVPCLIRLLNSTPPTTITTLGAGGAVQGSEVLSSAVLSRLALIAAPPASFQVEYSFEAANTGTFSSFP